MATTPSEPDSPPPLTEHERRVLAAIGEDLAAESANLARKLSAPPPRPSRRRGGAIDDVICAVAVLVVLGVLLPSAWFVVVVFVVAITAPALLAARFLREGGGVDRTDNDLPRRDIEW